MNYKFTSTVRDDVVLRKSFNELTQQTFGFDFEGWYQSGHWGDMYIPHVLLDGEKVVSNVSVNIMKFAVSGTTKHYIQLGTVMTDSEYRGQGLNREIMERILEEYKDKVDGIYLFGNDGVLNYYPKFGFKPAKEYEYYLPCNQSENQHPQSEAQAPYEMVKVDMSDDAQSEKLYDMIRECACQNRPNNNDALYMYENLGLYQFWMAAGFGNQVYYLPEAEAYVLAETQENTFYVNQILGSRKVDLARLAHSLGDHITEAVFGFTPVQKEKLQVREHKEEDCTLFILGEDLERIERDKMMFPVLSHA